VSSLDAELAHVRSDHELQLNRLAQTQRALDRAQHDLLENSLRQRAELNARASEDEKRRQEQAELESACKKNFDLQQLVDEIQRNRLQLQTDLEARLAAVVAQRDEAEKNLADARAQLQVAETGSAQKLIAEQLVHQQTQQTLSDTTEALLNEQAALGDARTQVADLQAQLDVLTESFNSQQQRHADALQTARAEVDEAKSMLETERHLIAQQTSVHQHEKHEAAVQRQLYHTRVTQLQSQLQHAESRLAQLQQQMGKQSTQHELDHAECTQRAIVAEQQADQMTVELAQLRSKLASEQDDRSLQVKVLTFNNIYISAFFNDFLYLS
jgi:hypothetical protein